MRTRSVVACVVMMAFGTAWAAPLKKRPQSTVLPMRKPIVVLPKAPIATVPRLPKATGTTTRTLELADVSGKHRFKVTFTASNAVDTRVFDYLARALRIAAVTPSTLRPGSGTFGAPHTTWVVLPPRSVITSTRVSLSASGHIQVSMKL